MEIQGETIWRGGDGMSMGTSENLWTTAQYGAGGQGGETIPMLLGSPKEKQQQHATKKKTVCQHHPGRAVNKIFTCCFRQIPSDGCVLADHHSFPPEQLSNLEKEWMFHSTPPLLPQSPVSSGLSPKRRRRKTFANTSTSQEHRVAVALDCEMGTAQTGDRELIRLTVVDFFTGAALIDSLVLPSVPMQHYNTRYSGVTAAMMREASRSGNCIRGRDATREALWRFIGPQTVVVVHGGENDMTSLRWICENVVDTFILAGDMKRAAKLKGGRSLKSLSLELLGRKVQEGKKGHDSLEDALATRELANWFVQQA
ncbi:hypothetical protein GP486_005244 [Trichoglossum hirsutum]|uniref:Exonuclease domain-containing protein n=1 Tax=Trichoglossum hirsutum TaxID=265104 RepID=A0A9P8L9S5_9PEZI|nr:hypothetical protein GP486_005244 [Trichoglossum hirsutum]